MNTSVNCPHCSTLVRWSPAQKYKPFCSERCKLQDLGAWFLEERSIKSSKTHSDSIDISDLPEDIQAEIKDLLN